MVLIITKDGPHMYFFSLDHMAHGFIIIIQQLLDFLIENEGYFI
jgi:hypothetical protein